MRKMRERDYIWAIMLYVCVKGLWSISSIQLDDRERGYMGNDTVCRCKGFIEYTVR